MGVIDERGKRVITEHEIRPASYGDTLRIDEGAILTPLAQDLARERDIRIESVRRRAARRKRIALRSEEHTSELQSLAYLVCRLLLEKKKTKNTRAPNVFVTASTQSTYMKHCT